jgi:hypothetical protein
MEVYKLLQKIDVQTKNLEPKTSYEIAVVAQNERRQLDI